MAAKGETGPPAVIWGHPTDPLLVLAAPFLRQPLAVLRLVAQSCPTLYNPIDCSPPGFSIQGDSPGQNTGVGCHALLQGIFLTQGSNPGLLHCRQILYRLSHLGSCIPSNHPGRGLQESESVSLSVVSTVTPWTVEDPAGSSVHGISQARILEWMTFLSLGIFLTQGSSLGSLALQVDSLPSEALVCRKAAFLGFQVKLSLRYPSAATLRFFPFPSNWKALGRLLSWSFTHELSSLSGPLLPHLCSAMHPLLFSRSHMQLQRLS